MSESRPEGPLNAEERDPDQETPSVETNEEWVDLASALNSVSTPFEEENSDRVSILSDVREALKEQILEHLYNQVLDELGSPEDMVRHVLREYADEVDESLQGARQTLSVLLRRKIGKQATQELDDVDALARKVVANIDPEAIAPVQKRVNAILRKQLLDQALRELQQQILGGDSDLLGKWLGDAGQTTTGPSITGQRTTSSVEGEPATQEETTPVDKASAPEGAAQDQGETSKQFDAEAFTKAMEKEVTDVAAAGGDSLPFADPTRELRVRGHCDVGVLIKKQQSTDKHLSQTLTGMPDMMLSGVPDDISVVTEEEVKVLARHVGERCHRALSKFAEDFLANMVDVDEQTESPLLALDTLYHVARENVDAFQEKVEQLTEQYQTLGFRLEISEREAVEI